MRKNLLKEVADCEDITNAIILTHNIDFIFLQSVVLSAFRKCGHPTLTIFADANCAAESFMQQSQLLDGIGVRYRVVPVAMAPGFRFHPKAVFLSGEKDATLFVGSGNITFGGWRENAEIWMRFDASKDGPAVFGEFYQYVKEILLRIPINQGIGDELREAFEPATRHWFSAAPLLGSPTLLGRVGSGASLLESIRSVQGSETVEELVVCAPYFDSECVALRSIIGQTAARRTTVFCQQKGSNLTRMGYEANSEVAKFENVSFEHDDQRENARTSFIHAKFYAFRRPDHVLMIAGSANCSRAALMANGSAGNAELMAIRRLSPEEYGTIIDAQLIRVPGLPTFHEPSTDSIDDSTDVSLRVLAAHFDNGLLSVAYTPERATVLICEVDGVHSRFTLMQAGILKIGGLVEPRLIRLQATIDNLKGWSLPAWVDLERQLRTSARGRNLVESIRARMQPGTWNAAGWSEIMDVFCKHLTYIPTSEPGRTTSDGTLSADPDGISYTYADVFAGDYQAPALTGLSLHAKLDGGKERSLQQLLLRWFGLEDGETEIADPLSPEGDVLSVTGDEVDRPEAFPIQVENVSISQPSDADKRRIKKVLQQVEEAMTTDKFLSERRPETLATDLKVASVLLRTGLCQGWIDAQEFFQLTNRIWTSLFFSRSGESSRGWIEFRQQNAEDKSGFISSMRSPELAAALLGWAFAATPDFGSPAAARFQLAVALAIARLPWLWDAGDEVAVSKELEILIARTGTPKERVISHIRAAWEKMFKTGRAFQLFEEAAMAVPMQDLRERIQAGVLLSGDLLWQGNAGYCVVTKETLRVEGRDVPVLRLQGQSENSRFLAQYTLPIRLMLKEDVLPLSPEFAAEPRCVLMEFMDQLQR